MDNESITDETGSCNGGDSCQKSSDVESYNDKSLAHYIIVVHGMKSFLSKGICIVGHGGFWMMGHRGFAVAGGFCLMSVFYSDNYGEYS